MGLFLLFLTLRPQGCRALPGSRQGAVKGSGFPLDINRDDFWDLSLTFSLEIHPKGSTKPTKAI